MNPAVGAQIPKVSFIVPCYKLSHLLRECVESIQAQSYEDFEVLIMDDCSPDNTAEITQSFTDRRVKYVRNSSNLGHLRNYNKGIELARGRYVWLISADDRLRSSRVLERYLEVMERHAEIGFACCPGIEIKNGKDAGVAKYSVQAPQDTIFKGHDFLDRLLESNCVVAASGMVRKTCYKSLGAFPLDLPYAGDWYLWCLFALHYDVAYFAEPMVDYRIHEQSMTNSLFLERARRCLQDDLEVLWRIKEIARARGDDKITVKCRRAIALEHARQLTGKYKASAASITLSESDGWLKKHARNTAEEKWIRARSYIFIAEFHFRTGNLAEARRFYRYGLSENPWILKVWIKRMLLCSDALGPLARRLAGALRQLVRESAWINPLKKSKGIGGVSATRSSGKIELPL